MMLLCNRSTGRWLGYALCIELFLSCSLSSAWNGPHHNKHEPSVSRRRVLATSSACLSAHLIHPMINCPAHADPSNALLPIGSGGIMQRPSIQKATGWMPPTFITKLASSRIGTMALSPLQQLPFASQETYYPAFLFGEWNVTATLQQKYFPFGPDFVPSKSLLEGSPRYGQEQIGDTTTFLLHYFSTLADTTKNQIIVNLGLGIPQSKIIADRAYNILSISRAYRQSSPVQTIEWDYRKDSTRISIQMESIADDMRPLGQRRSEVYLTARQTEEAINDETGRPLFAVSERSRTVTVGPGTVSANDQEVITEYQQIDDNTVKAVSRIAVYLTPNPNSREGVLWQQISGKAVAFYDYELNMHRNLEEFREGKNDTTISRPCVKTPKDIIQCE